MLNFRCIFYILVFIILWNKVNLLENGLARTPPMGWMSWGYYMCGVNCEDHPEKCLNEDLILSVADIFYDEGFQEAGYEYIIIDDCWAEMHRDSNGRLVPDSQRFPRGMKYIADYIHSRGLKFGMYTNVAETTCMGYPGSKDYFKIDAQTFAEWGIDYLKVDGCFVGEQFLNTAYIKLGEYLNKTGRPMVYSCSWPYYIEFIHKKKPNYGNITAHCNLWRNYHDVTPRWDAIRNIVKHYEAQYPRLSPHHGPGHWNDPDMLIFGTDSLTESQSRVQMSVYAMMSAPLLLSCDMRRVTRYEKQQLLNMDLVAIDQDPLGIMAKPYQLNHSITMWVKPHLPRKGDIHSSFSFALVNLEPTEFTVSFTPGQYGLNSTDGYMVMDVFTAVFLWNITLRDAITATVPGEDVILYTMYPL